MKNPDKKDCPNDHEDKQWRIWKELRERLTEEQLQAIRFIIARCGHLPL